MYGCIATTMLCCLQLNIFAIKKAHQFTNSFSAAMNDFFVILDIPSTAIISVSVAHPPPVDIWPHTAAKLLSQYGLPLNPFTFLDVVR